MNSCLNAGDSKNITYLKRKQPQLKIFLGLGGWKERIEKNYSEVAESPSRRKAVASNVSQFLR
jgi:GH18 family chitinase